jgi:crossover junction endodeoxyribonuclease RuvC
MGTVIVLGIDPGTAATGYGIVERNGSHLRMVEFGVLETLAGGTAGERLVAIHAGVAELIERHRPALVGVERIFFSRNVQTAFSVGQARGVAILAAAQSGLPIYEYTPNEVKIAVTGYGRASKDQVQRMVQTVLGLAQMPTPDDAADALAVAICLAHSYREMSLPANAVHAPVTGPIE